MEKTRAELFEEIAGQVVFLADVYEHDFSDQGVARYVRETLVPFVEAEGNLKADADQVADHLASQGQ